MTTLNLLDDARDPEVDARIEALKRDDWEVHHALYGDGMEAIAKTLRKERKHYQRWMVGG